MALDIFDFMEKASAILGTPGYEADIGAHFAGLFCYEGCHCACAYGAGGNSKKSVDFLHSVMFLV